MQDRERLDCDVEVLRHEVPENLGPEESMYSSCYLVFILLVFEAYILESVLTDSRREDDQSSPVVLDEFAHFLLKISSRRVVQQFLSFPCRVRFPFPKFAPILSKNVAKESNGLKVVRLVEKTNEVSGLGKGSEPADREERK